MTYLVTLVVPDMFSAHAIRQCTIRDPVPAPVRIYSYVVVRILKNNIKGIVATIE